MLLLWSPEAERDADEIWDYYAAIASQDVAERVIRSIEEGANRIVARPLIGRARNDVAPGLRSLRREPYLILYRTEQSFVEIVRILHERRDLQAALSSNMM